MAGHWACKPMVMKHKIWVVPGSEAVGASEPGEPVLGPGQGPFLALEVGAELPSGRE